MSRTSLELLGSFQRRLRSLESTRRKQEALFQGGHLIKRDIEEVYGAIFMSVLVSFEALIEDLFIDLLAGKVVHTQSDIKAKLSIRVRQLARDLVCHGQPYYDWLPYERTEKIAKIFFREGKPFTLLNRDSKKHIERCLVVRNAIAHQSQHSSKKFKNTVLSNISLPPRSRTPKAFLRAQFAAAPQQTYSEQYISGLYRIAQGLC